MGLRLIFPAPFFLLSGKINLLGKWSFLTDGLGERFLLKVHDLPEKALKWVDSELLQKVNLISF